MSKLLALSLSITATSANYSSLSSFFLWKTKMGERLREANKKSSRWKAESESFSGYWCKVNKANWPRRGTLQGLRVIKDCTLLLFGGESVCHAVRKTDRIFSPEIHTTTTTTTSSILVVEEDRERARAGRCGGVTSPFTGTCFNGILVCRDGLVPLFLVYSH